MKPRLNHLLVAVLACVFAAGCLDSKNPLADPGDVEPDGRLSGLWLQETEQGANYYHIGPIGGEAPPSMMSVVLVQHQNDARLKTPEQLLLFPTELDGKTYLNVAGPKPEQIESIEEQGWQPGLLDAYLLMKYRVEDDALLVWGLRADAVRTAIEAGRIDGQVEQKERFWHARLTAPTDKLASFVANQGDALLADKPIRLKRIR